MTGVGILGAILWALQSPSPSEEGMTPATYCIGRALGAAWILGACAWF